MNIDNIKCILTVADCLSINKASMLVYKSQPQVSHIIQQFEKLVGVKIFERSTQGLKITPEGVLVLEYCKEIAEIYDKMLNVVTPSNNKDYKGKLTIYNTPNIHNYHLELLDKFHAQYPEISLHVITASPDDILDKLPSEDTALAFFYQIYSANKKPYYYIPSDLQYLELIQSPLYALCSLDSPYTKKYKTISLKTLSTLPLLEYKPFNNELSFSEIMFNFFNISIKEFTFTVDDVRLVHNILSTGNALYLGIAHSNKLLKNDLTSIPIRDKVTCGFGLLTAKQSQNKLVTLLQQYLISEYKKL